MNSVNLIGRLVKDPELRYTPNGKAVATFVLAVDRKFKNAQGEREADYPQCTIWGQSAEVLANNVKKGHKISVEGRIQTRTYDDKDGKKQYVTEVVADSFGFLEKKTTAGNSLGQEIEFHEGDIPF